MNINYNISSLLLLTQLLFESCNTNSTQKSKVDIPDKVSYETLSKIDTIEYKLAIDSIQGEKYSAYFQYYEFKGEHECINPLNQLMVDLVFDGQSNLEHYLKRYNKSFPSNKSREYFEKDIEEINLLLNSDSIVSFYHSDYQDREGGARMFGTYKGIIYNVSHCKLLNLDDIIDPTNVSMIIKLIKNAAIQRVNQDPEFTKEINMMNLKLSNNFVIDTNHVSFIYPNSVFTFAREEIFIKIPFDQILPYIKAESRVYRFIKRRLSILNEVK